MTEYRLKTVDVRNFFTLSNLSIAPEGRHVRIAGRTGAGKTTVVGAILYIFSSQDAKGHKRIPGATVDFTLTGSERPDLPVHPALLCPQIHEGHPTLLIKEILYPRLSRLESELRKVKSKIKFLSDMTEYLEACESIPPVRITNERIELMKQLDKLYVDIDQYKYVFEADLLFVKWNAYKDYHYLSYAEKVAFLFNCVADIEERLGIKFFKLVDDGERLSPEFVQNLKSRWQVIYTWKEYNSDLTVTVED